MRLVILCRNDQTCGHRMSAGPDIQSFKTFQTFLILCLYILKCAAQPPFVAKLLIAEEKTQKLDRLRSLAIQK